MFERGYAKLGSWRGVPLRAHFTLVFGLLYVSRADFAPGTWAGYLLIVILHELGHALLVWRYGLRVHAIELHGLGGHCLHQPTRSAWQDAVIAWGGVLMQLALFAVVSLVAPQRLPAYSFGADFRSVLLGTNLTIAMFNLLPVPGFDGAAAWQLPGLAYRRFARWRRGKAGRPTAPRRSRPPAPRPSSGSSSRPHDASPNLRLVRGEDGDFRFDVVDEDRETRRK